MNATVNGSSCFDVFYSPASKIGETITYCLIFVVSLVGNSLIAIVVYKTPILRKSSNVFIVNMAMSDLLCPIFLFPWTLTELHSNGSWFISGPLGQALCKLAPFLSDVSTIVSVQSLVLIAVDRFGAVMLPLRSPVISSKVCPYFILATWIVAMAIFSPDLLAFKLVEIEGQVFCGPFWNEAFREFSSYRTYWLTVFVVFLYTPIILLAALYSIILIKLNTEAIPGEQPTNAEQLRAKRNTNVLKLAIAIVLGFTLCHLPFSIMRMLFFFDSELPSTCSFFFSFVISLLLTRSNCAINPLICFIFSGNYQRAFKQLFKCFSNTDQGRSALNLKKISMHQFMKLLRPNNALFRQFSVLAQSQVKNFDT